MILPSRSISQPILILDYYITGIPAPGGDVTQTQTTVTVDETDPVVQFATAPLSLDDADLELLQFSVLIIEEGGMPEGDLQVNWAFMRNGLIMQNGQSESMIPYVASNDGTWTYSGSIDFTEGINVSLEEGDELIWWIDVVDLAGNSARGTGLSTIDPMRTDFTVLSFDMTVTNIEIALADGSTPRGNEVVEGTEISVVVDVRNLGTKAGTVTISLVEDMGESRTWLVHGEMDLSLSPGQTMETIPLMFETHGAGPQNLYVNVTGMDIWIDNSMLPHCYSMNGNATCDLNVESDMPRVISQEDAESGMSAMTAIVSILALLLLGAGFAIVVLLRRDNSDESIFYDDDDDEWDDDSDEYVEEEQTRILPPMAPSRPDMDAATKALQPASDDESEDADESNKLEETPNVSEDPWADVDHSEEE